MATVTVDPAKAKAAFHQQVWQRLRAAGVAVEAEAKRLAPVRTGNLRARIHLVEDEANLRVRIVSPAPYTLFVEMGTRLQVGHPFLRPALLAAKKLWRGFSVSQVFSASFPGTMPMPRASSRAIAMRTARDKRMRKRRHLGHVKSRVTVHTPAGGTHTYKGSY